MTDEQSYYIGMSALFLLYGIGIFLIQWFGSEWLDEREKKQRERKLGKRLPDNQCNDCNSCATRASLANATKIRS